MTPSPKAPSPSSLNSPTALQYGRTSTGSCSKTHLAFRLFEQTHEALLGREDGVAGSQTAHVIVDGIQLSPLQKTQPDSELPLILGHSERSSHILHLPVPQIYMASPSTPPGTDRQADEQYEKQNLELSIHIHLQPPAQSTSPVPGLRREGDAAACRLTCFSPKAARKTINPVAHTKQSLSRQHDKGKQLKY